MRRIEPAIIEPSGAFDVVLTASVSEAPDVPVRVTAEGRALVHRAAWVPPGRVRVEPESAWPPGRVQIELLPGWIDVEGRELSVGAGASVQVVDDVEAPTWLLEAPRPNGLAPPNLAAVVLAVRPVVPIDRVRLVSDDGAVEFDDVDTSVVGQVRARGRPVCPPLCPRAQVRVQVDGLEPVEGGGTFQVLDVPDRRAPRVRSVQAIRHGAGIDLDFELDEPGWVELEGPGVGVRSFPFGFQRSAGTLTGLPEAPLTLAVRTYDLALNAREAEPVTVETVSVPQVRFSEVVATPLRDWGDSEPAGLPFDGRPGAGTVSDADEWIEIVHRGDRPLDLTRVSIEIRAEDGTPSVTPLAGSTPIRFGSGGRLDRWLPGEAAVVRLRGTLSSTDLTLSLVSGSRTLDRIRLGTDADHPGGSPPDAVHESVALGLDGRWRWCVPTPTDPIPPVDCRAP